MSRESKASNKEPEANGEGLGDGDEGLGSRKSGTGLKGTVEEEADNDIPEVDKKVWQTGKLKTYEQKTALPL